MEPQEGTFDPVCRPINRFIVFVHSMKTSVDSSANIAHQLHYMQKFFIIELLKLMSS